MIEYFIGGFFCGAVFTIIIAALSISFYKSEIKEQ